MDKQKQATLEAFKEIRKLLALPEHWTWNAFARDVEGAPCDETDPEATCFCLVGAALKAQLRPVITVWQLIQEMVKTLREINSHYPSPASFNDAPETTHADILRLLDLTIERLSKEIEA